MLLFLALTLTNCLSSRCESADYEVSGICIIENKYKPNENEIKEAVNLLEHWVNRRSNKQLDIHDLIEERDVAIEYVEAISFPDRDVAATVSHNSYIKIERPEVQVSELYQECLLHMAYISHELMHIIAEKWMKVDGDSSYNHNVPYLFEPEHCRVIDTNEDIEGCDNNVETDVISTAGDYCYERIWGYPRSSYGEAN
jgi:hypothetical protein